MIRAKALILAAGRGERMRPLTDTTPKPLLTVRGQPLIQWPMEALARGGFTDVVVNTAWLGERIEQHFGTAPLLRGRPLALHYSREGRDFGGALETLGGIVRVLPALHDVFWVMAGDVFAPQFSFTQEALLRFASSGKLGHLWLVPNPPHNAKGDFGLGEDGLALNQAAVRHTFSTIALYRKALFAPPYCGIPAGNPQGEKAPVVPLLRTAMDNRQISAELYTGPWTDVGTPERLAQLNETA